MKTLKTIAATAIVVLAGSAVAFGGIHFGGPQAGPATALASPQPSQAKVTYTVKLSAKDLVRLAAMMNGQHRVRQQRRAGVRTGYALYRTTSYRTANRTTQHSTYRRNCCRTYSTHPSRTCCRSHSTRSWGGTSHGGCCGW